MEQIEKTGQMGGDRHHITENQPMHNTSTGSMNPSQTLLLFQFNIFFFEHYVILIFPIFLSKKDYIWHIK